MAPSHHIPPNHPSDGRFLGPFWPFLAKKRGQKHYLGDGLLQAHAVFWTQLHYIERRGPKLYPSALDSPLHFKPDLNLFSGLFNPILGLNWPSSTPLNAFRPPQSSRVSYRNPLDFKSIGPFHCATINNQKRIRCA